VSRRAPLRAVAVATAIAGLVAGALPAPAAADRAARPVTKAAPGDELPVEITLNQLEPREVRPDSPIAVIATLRNTGDEPTGPLQVGLRRGSRITTRSELAATDTAPPPVTTAFAPTLALPDGLAPGQRIQVRYRCTPADLGIGQLGVYPVAFTVQAGFDEPVGEIRTFLPFFPPGQQLRPTAVAWMWPLLDRPRRLTGDGVDGTATAPVFLDDRLAQSVSPGGRLHRLLGVAERYVGKVRLTLVVDPETIEALQLMATRGYRIRREGRLVPGTGGTAASLWLARLRQVAPRHLLVAVPYADPDVVALVRGGSAPLARPVQADADTLARTLGVPPTTRVAWPAGGLLTDAALDAVVAGGANTVVLDAAALPGGVTGDTPTPSAVSPLPALGATAAALVTDAKLQSLVTAAMPGSKDGAALFRGGPRVAEQRYLAELAMITAEAPNLGRTLVVAPPRRWNPTTAYALGVIANIAGVSWLTSLGADEAVLSAPPADRGALVYPPAAHRSELSAAQVRTIGEVQALVTDMRTALSNPDANQLLSAYNDALRRAGSSAWRDAPAVGRAYAAGLAAEIRRLRGQVGIVTPSAGVYSLASEDSPLSLTVVNELTQPVRIRVRVNSTGTAGFSTRDIGVQQIPAESRTTLRVPASVERTGTFAVQAQLTTPAGGALGAPVTLTVRSTAYGSLALGITGLALLVLVGAVVVRLVRRVRGGAAGPPPPPGTPADRAAA
jgi:Family of unknown function (DUF6049)